MREISHSLLIIGVFIFFSCNQSSNNDNYRKKDEQIIDINKKKNSSISEDSKNQVDEPSEIKLIDKSVKFLWRDMKFDSTLNRTLNSIIINQEYIKTMTDAEKAAIGYVATFIGNECWWNGEANDNRSNLDCKIITALGLGYQCSDTHLGFLRKWFSNDKKVLSELEKGNCPTTPDTATIQDTFNEIELTIKNDTIIVYYEVCGMNMREQNSWEWSESDYFLFKDNKLKLLKKGMSEVTYETFEISG